MSHLSECIKEEECRPASNEGPDSGAECEPKATVQGVDLRETNIPEHVTDAQSLLPEAAFA